MTGSAFAALISIHDVMPATFHRVYEIMRMIDKHAVAPVSLLISTGFEWREEEIEQLRSWHARGHQLAGHGLTHHATQISGLYHRLHSACISSDVAEHLALKPDEIEECITRCFDWFIENQFQAPQLYVPPGWAMGRLSRKRLGRLPFRFYETLTGIYDSELETMHRLPLVGFEANSPGMGLFLRTWNRVSLFSGRKLRKPARIAIHPGDLSLRLSGQLQELLKQPMACVSKPSGILFRTNDQGPQEHHSEH